MKRGNIILFFFKNSDTTTKNNQTKFTSYVCSLSLKIKIARFLKNHYYIDFYF